MTELERKELERQRAYATRQFEIYSAHQKIQLAKGNISGARNWIDQMTGCNDFIDTATRKLDGLETDRG